MSRSLKKGPFVNEKLLAKVIKMDEAGKKAPIKTWARHSSISPLMVGHTLSIHDGKSFKDVFVTEAMVGHKLGEFAATRKFVAHSRKGFEKPTTT
ncbi:30S ribosomal protein S19 [bacterium]|uniref:Small ribosomal subunit protein uS19 n=2 Tax=Katanobacteria TaxID=422282 RepID=A0A2M7X307_UNCKA|nr:30S ribosomal protein S19 [bacterium]PIP56916.1 MAG: 30S ribosomal protein S19 [candidate division WWE3 bacterium CG22_combo_CG10-13_8_21_14_all_39_12]PJA40554.1 MAG: 30S ribosomal protein S19 [candidate division WWE3 bacterium CG_4_9_14_3_um_filter_39_7]